MDEKAISIAIKQLFTESLELSYYGQRNGTLDA